MTEDELFAAVHEYSSDLYPTWPAALVPEKARAKLLEAIRAWAYAPQHIDKIATPEGWVSVLELHAKAAVCDAFVASQDANQDFEEHRVFVANAVDALRKLQEKTR
jgi:hypothetical protein